MKRSVVALTAVTVAVAGCGSGPTTPSGTPRATVLRFIDDLQARRTQRACAALDPSAISDLRQTLLSGVRPPGRTATERLRFIRRINTASKRCPVSLRLLADQLGNQLPRIRSNAASGKLRKLSPPETWFLGGDDWVIEPHDGRWVIVGTGALVLDS